jgi:DNA-binding response OmpR family regulator
MGQQDAGSHCIVVADSEVLVRNAIADYLRHCGYRVIEAANSDEALTVLKSDDTPVEAVLCDAEVAGELSAFELRVWIRENRPQVQIVLAGNIDAAAKAAGQMCDKGPHLKRPYDAEAVANHIRIMLATARDKQG